MEEHEIFGITSMFYFKGEILERNVCFFKDCIKIDDNKCKEIIRYTDIEKIKYNSKTIKIVLKDRSKIKIPCSSPDIKKIKTLFRAKQEFQGKEFNGSALVSMGTINILVPIRSNDLKLLRASIIQRIAKHFYPACENTCITQELFDNLMIFVDVGDEKYISVVDGCDLEAALLFFGNRLKIKVDFFE
ncbi:hypothetical protein GINT2_001367 [Glugoides intestinalis]